MRDLRRDLRERIIEIEAETSELIRDYNREKAELDKRYSLKSDPLEEERKAVNNLLNIQQNRFGEEVTSLTPLMSLPDFLVRYAARSGLVGKDEFKRSAAEAGYFADGDSGGRTIHTTLLNLVRNGRLREDEHGQYFATPDTDRLSSAVNRIGEEALS